MTNDHWVIVVPMMVERTIAARTHGRYLLDVSSVPGAPMLVGFHGYGEEVATQLERLRAVRRTSAWTIVAVQGLHRFYARGGRQTVASWMTREDRELLIEDNLVYIDSVIDAVASECGEPSAVVYAGFSQGASMAYRAAALGRRDPTAVIAMGGDVPPELNADRLARARRALIGWAAHDTFYTRAKRSADEGRLKHAGLEATVVELDAGHAWTDAFSDAAFTWLRQLV